MTRDDIIELMSTNVWREAVVKLIEQRDALKDMLGCGGMIDKESLEKTAMDYVETSAEIRMYDEFINLDELLFGPKGEDDGD